MIGTLKDLLILPAELKDEKVKYTYPEPEKNLEEETYITQRLREQRKWYILSARKNLHYYAGFQILIILSGLLCSFLKFQFSGALAITALGYSLTMALICCRDFLRCGDLFSHYTASAISLKDLEDDYFSFKDKVVDKYHPILLRQLVEKGENILTTEANHWYAAQGGQYFQDKDFELKK